MATIPESKALTGQLVSTESAYGGTGLARVVDGVEFVSGGNGWYYPLAESIGAPHKVFADGGRRYRAALGRLALPPAYRRL